MSSPAEGASKQYPVPDDDAAWRAEWRAEEQLAFAAASRVIVSSRQAARLLTPRLDPRLLQILPRGVDRRLFRAKRENERTDEAVTVTVFGGTESVASWEVVRPLLPALVDALPADSVELRLLGAPASDDDTWHTRFRASAIAHHVRLLTSDAPAGLADHLARSDIVIVPSRAEHGIDPWTVPYRALEAMACAAATIITGPAASFKDTITPERDAIVVPAGAPARLAEAALRLLHSPALRSSLAAGGEVLAASQADLSRSLAAWASLFAELLGADASPCQPEVTAPAAAGPTARSPRAPRASRHEGAEGVSGVGEAAASRNLRARRKRQPGHAQPAPAPAEAQREGTTAPEVPKKTEPPASGTLRFRTELVDEKPTAALDPWAGDTIADATPFGCQGDGVGPSNRSPRSEDFARRSKRDPHRGNKGPETTLDDAAPVKRRES